MGSKHNRWLLVAGMALAILLAATLLFFLAPETIRLLRRDSTWRAMQSTGVWRVGMDPSFPPFEMLDSAGRPAGFDVALAEALAAALGVNVELIPIGFDSLLDALQTGKIDSIISALPFDERMTRDVAYSAPYFEAGIFLATRPATGVQGTESLANRTVGVEWGSMGEMVGRRLQKTMPTLQLQRFDTPTAAIDALVKTQTVEAILIDNVTLRIAQVQGAPLVAVGPVLESNPFVIAMPVAAYELQAAVEETLTQMRMNGELATLEERWFATTP